MEPKSYDRLVRERSKLRWLAVGFGVVSVVFYILGLKTLVLLPAWFLFSALTLFILFRAARLTSKLEVDHNSYTSFRLAPRRSKKEPTAKD